MVRDRTEERMLDDHYTEWEKKQRSEKDNKLTEEVTRMMKNVWITKRILPEEDIEMQIKDEQEEENRMEIDLQELEKEDFMDIDERIENRR